MGLTIFSHVSHKGERVGLHADLVKIVMSFLDFQDFNQVSLTCKAAVQLKDFKNNPGIIKIFLDKISLAFESLRSTLTSRSSYLLRFRLKAYHFLKESDDNTIQERLAVVQNSNLPEIDERLRPIVDTDNPGCCSRSCAAHYLGAALCGIAFPIIMILSLRLTASVGSIVGFYLSGAALGMIVGSILDYYVIDRHENRALLRAVNPAASPDSNSLTVPLVQQSIRELPVSHNTNLSDVLDQLESGEHNISFR